MNTSQAKEISILTVLFKMGIHPQKTNGSQVWFLSPFSKERNPSFKIDKIKNRWYCHSSGFGGNTLDFVVKHSRCTVSDALAYLSDFETSFPFSFQEQKNLETPVKEESNVNIEKIISIQHLALVQYLKSRGISKFQTESNLKEVHYTIKDRKYFAIGFENRSGGFEIRSKYAKICLGKKDISIISNQSQILRIFEGFFDYLSYSQIRDNKKLKQSDYLILNSVALITKNLSVLANYQTIELYLDNDTAGNKYTEIIKEAFQNSIDFREFFLPFKDLNEWFMACELEVL